MLWRGTTLVVPKNVVCLSVCRSFERVMLSNTENLTRLSVQDDVQTVTTPPCPNLQELELCCATLSEQGLVFEDMPRLATMRVWTKAVGPTFRLPTQLTALFLEMDLMPEEVALLTPLTRLRQLDIASIRGYVPLDLSGLTTLTRLNAYKTPVSRLPTSLVECVVFFGANADLSQLPNLTSLSVGLGLWVKMTFPTVLKRLEITHGRIDIRDIHGLKLESFKCVPG